VSRRALALLVIAAIAGGLLVFLVVFVRSDVQSFRIPSESMMPTLEVDDRITVNKDAYDDVAPQVGDIVVLHPPEGALEARCGEPVPAGRLCPRPVGDAADVFFVDRIVAGPGDRLRIVDGRATVDGERLDEPYAEECAIPESCTFRGSITIPDDHFFVMGDNRGASDDSRFWGPVPRDQIVGRADRCLPLGLKCEKTSDPG
jgi:signal peptidase I